MALELGPVARALPIQLREGGLALIWPGHHGRAVWLADCQYDTQDAQLSREIGPFGIISASTPDSNTYHTVHGLGPLLDQFREINARFIVLLKIFPLLAI